MNVTPVHARMMEPVTIKLVNMCVAVQQDIQGYQTVNCQTGKCTEILHHFKDIKQIEHLKNYLFSTKTMYIMGTFSETSHFWSHCKSDNMVCYFLN